jgi:hypothetical protein
MLEQNIHSSRQSEGVTVVTKPFSMVPFRRDSGFVDRDDILTRVEEKCSQPAGRVDLVGIGGVG